MTEWTHVGVDWDSGACVAVGLDEKSRFSAAVFDRMGELWSDVQARVERIVVDVPIGLCGTTEDPQGCEQDDEDQLVRNCDRLARRVIGSRYSSVFNPPCRQVIDDAVDRGSDYELKADVYAGINAMNRNHTGKGLMRQALSIAPGIAEIDDLFSTHDIDPHTLVEGDPEVCFRACAGGELRYSKGTAPGLVERLDALEQTEEYERDVWRELANALGDSGYAVGIDDLVDALALALTACGRKGDDLHSLPAKFPTDGANRPMRMVYRRDRSFDVG